jgi:hypothetical protein
MLDLACKRMRSAHIGAIIYPGYVLQHLLSDDGKGVPSSGMVERVAIVAGDGYYEVRRENRQVKISPTYILHPPTLASRMKLRKKRRSSRLQSGDSDVLWRWEFCMGWGRFLEGLGVGLRWSRGWSSIRIH